MKEMPKTIQIGPIPYKVKRKKRVHSTEGEWLAGSLWDFGQRIHVDPDAKDQFQAVVLLHECMHGIFYNAGMRGEHDEYMIEVISFGIADLIRQNPELIDYIQEAMK